MSVTSKPVLDLAYMPDLVGIQVRNVQAVSAAQQKMLEGFSLLTTQVLQIVDSLARRSFANTQPSSTGSDMGGRIDQLKQMIVDVQASSNTLSEIMVRSAGEAASTLQARMMASLDELKTLVEKPSATKLLS
jgi:hypothetical protein